MVFVPVTFVTIFFISQIIVGIYLLSEVSQIKALAYIGVGLYVVSGLVFGWLPVIEFRKKGGVRKGKSYIHTTQLVDTGIYSIVRHPQYVTFILWAIAGILLFQQPGYYEEEKLEDIIQQAERLDMNEVRAHIANETNEEEISKNTNP